MKHTFMKRLNGFLLMVTLAVLLSASAFATGIVSIINLTVAAPKVGEVPANTASLPATASTQVLSVTWSPSDATFKENCDYTVTVQLGIKPGLDKKFTSNMSKMSVKVNGNKTTNVTPNGVNVIVTYTFKAAGTSNSAAADNTAKDNQTAHPVFTDVKADDYFAEAVNWAVEKQITTGTTATTFSPNDTCTRAQILTFMWRAAGSPKRDGFIIFDDVSANQYYYEPAMWAKDHTMVTGRNFEPYTPCTRASTVIYLWKNAGSPKTEVLSTFTDVKADAEYAQAVAWAVKNGVTNGTSATTFSPDDTCTRGQIVTFLKRASTVPVTPVQPDPDDKDDSDDPDDSDEPAKPTDPAEDDKKDEDTKKDDNTKKDDSTDPSDETQPNVDAGKGAPSNEKKSYDKAVYEAAVQKALREALGDDLGEGLSDVAKALRLHDWLVEHCTYDLTYKKKYSHSEYGSIVDGFAVCDGYTKGYNDLLSRVGIQAEQVVGFADNGQGMGLHAWSVVTIDGVKYHVDVTWDDPVPDIAGTIGRTFFLVSDAALVKHYDYKVHCSDRRYEKGWLFAFNALPLFWEDGKNGFYYVDLDKVKFTTELEGTLDSVSTSQASSAIRTEDGKYICFFLSDYVTSHYPMYLYDIEADEYYTYTGIKDIPNVIFCILRQNGNTVEVSRQYYDTEYSMPWGFGVQAKVELPTSTEKRHVTFDPNYDGGKTTSCYYLNAYWHAGDEPLQTLSRQGLTFGGWYTEKDGGTKIESLDEIKGDDVTLYAHWWQPWVITKAPTETEEGTAERALDGYPEVKEEVVLPTVLDTSVWERKTEVPSTSTRQGWVRYTSEYGEIRVLKPLLPPEKLEYGITYKDGSVYVTVLEETTYTVVYEAIEDGEVVSTGNMSLISNGEGEYRIITPKSFTPSGTVKATLYDSDMNELASIEYEAG